MSFNKVTIVGYLGRDPELRYTPQGTAVCNFSVATTEKRRNARGETEEHTIWFRVAAWGRQAEVANEYLAKGRQVYVEGRLRLEEYTDREGNPRTSAEVNAGDIHFLGQCGDATTGRAERPDEINRADEEADIVESPKSTSPRSGMIGCEHCGPGAWNGSLSIRHRHCGTNSGPGKFAFSMRPIITVRKWRQ
jgi:single-strand DNA-binding protein